MRPFVLAALAAGVLVVGCASNCRPFQVSVAAAPPPATSATALPYPSPVAMETARPTPAQAPDHAVGAAPGVRERRPPAAPASPPAVMPQPVTPIVSTAAPSPDPRVGLAAGRWDAGQAAWNMRLVSTTPPDEKFLGANNSDLAFTGKYTIQGNYNGFQVFDISRPADPVPVLTYVCPASQSDVSVFRNLLFVSGEGLTGRLDCGMQGVPEPVSHERLRGIRIFDISNIESPKYIANVQTCRGSHTHTVVTDPQDKDNIYIYVSGSARVRPEEELPGCKDGPIGDPETARFRLEVIKVPLAAPQRAAIVSSPRIFYGLTSPPTRLEGARGGAATAAGDDDGIGDTGRAAGAAAAVPATVARGGPRGRRGAPPQLPSGPSQCHDITVYPDIGLAGGACGGYGLLLDIREAAHPIRIDAAADPNMSFWHSATFSNDGTKVLFSDEWGGGTQPRCRPTDKPEWGANALFTIEKNKLVFKSYYKLPAAQTPQENCVAHNGSLVPIPGREVMVQGWYQGGISVFDWTDVSKPKEIAFFDRGPIDATRLISGGSWSVYWYNGLVVSSEIARGLDIFELLPSGLITRNELDAAKTVQWDYLNAQEQRKVVWPASFAKARAFLDQLERGSGLPAARIKAIDTELAAAETMPEAARQAALGKMAAQLTTEAERAADRPKVRMLVAAIRELAALE